jgi:hypothetical protein
MTSNKDVHNFQLQEGLNQIKNRGKDFAENSNSSKFYFFDKGYAIFCEKSSLPPTFFFSLIFIH